MKRKLVAFLSVLMVSALTVFGQFTNTGKSVMMDSKTYKFLDPNVIPSNQLALTKGDITGDTNTTTVIRLQGKAIPAPTPADDGKGYVYNAGLGVFQLAAGGGGGAWGTITGTITNQTDLWAELTNRYTKSEIDGKGYLTNEALWNASSNNVPYLNRDNTYGAGTIQSFALATLTNNASSGTDIVNWRTMTNYTATIPVGSAAYSDVSQFSSNTLDWDYSYPKWPMMRTRSRYYQSGVQGYYDAASITSNRVVVWGNLDGGAVGFRVMDYSNPYNLSKVCDIAGAVGFQSIFSDGTFSNNYVFGCGNDSLLRVYDFTTVSSPTFASYDYPSGAQLWDLTSNGSNLMFVSDVDDGRFLVYVISTDAPPTLTLCADLHTSSAYMTGVAYNPDDNVAYSADLTTITPAAHVFSYTISGTNVTFVGSTNCSFSAAELGANKMMYYRKHLYVYSYLGDSLDIFSVAANPTNPVLIKTITMTGKAPTYGDMYGNDDYVYIGDETTGKLQIYNVSDPTNAYLAGYSLNSYGYSWNPRILDNGMMLMIEQIGAGSGDRDLILVPDISDQLKALETVSPKFNQVYALSTNTNVPGSLVTYELLMDRLSHVDAINLVGTTSTVAGVLLTHNVIPAASNAYDLGSLEMPWRDLYLDTNSIYMGGKKVLSYNAATTSLVVGATLAEVGTLTGVAHTTIDFVHRDDVRAWRDVASSANGANLVACTYLDGAIYTSTDSGANWVAHVVGIGFWNGVASSVDGTRLVAVAYGGGSPPIIATSVDAGTNWNTHTPTPAGHTWKSVASSADGTKLVACDEGGSTIWTSTDAGTNWTQRGSAGHYEDVASSADGTRLISCIYPYGYLLTSTDAGTNWTARLDGDARNWRSVASSADGTKLVAVVEVGQIWTSTDAGTNWTPHGEVQPWECVTSSADGTRLAAGMWYDNETYFDGRIYTSEDAGTNWAPLASPVRGWIALSSSADGNKLVAADGSGPSVTGRVYTAQYVNYDDALMTHGIRPVVSNAYDLGSLSVPFRDLYLGTNSIYMGGIKALRFDADSQSLIVNGNIAQPGCFASGTNTVAFGTGSRARSSYSAAFGRGTLATNLYAFAEGFNSYAYGIASHVEGENNISSNDSSHAEGLLTKALGVTAHSEGFQTIADGNYSHAEGTLTRAGGIASHAAGFGMVVTSSYSWGWSDGRYMTNGTMSNFMVVARTSQFYGDVMPGASNAYSLGSLLVPWKDLYLATNSLYLGTNKVSVADGTLTVNNVAVGGGALTVKQLTYTSTNVVTDLSQGDIFKVTITNNALINNPTGGSDGKAYTWWVKQDASGEHVITLGTNFVIPSSATQPLAWSTNANAMTMLGVRYDATAGKCYVVSLVPGY